MDKAFRYALRPPVHECLSRILKPLTLGHWFTLASYCPGSIGERGDANLVLATFICSQSWAESRRLIGKRSTTLYFWLWGRLCARLDKEQEHKKWDAYLDTSFLMPRIDRADGNSPLVWRLYVSLMSDFHMSKESALEVPVAEALCLYTVKEEERGRLQFAHPNITTLWDHFERCKKEAQN